jgi:hypothetical protein
MPDRGRAQRAMSRSAVILVRNRRLIRPCYRWQRGCVVGDRPDQLLLTGDGGAGEDSGSDDDD